MSDHRTKIDLYLGVADKHEDNELISSKLEAFWKSYDELVVAIKMVDDGEIRELQKSQLASEIVERIRQGQTFAYPWNTLIGSGK